MMTNYIGKPESRADGNLKVTGAAKYAAEYNVPALLYGYTVSSHIEKGKIAKFDLSCAEKWRGAGFTVARYAEKCVEVT